jgi:hypothetical protein
MRWLRMPLLALYCITGLVGAARAADPEIWFNPYLKADFPNMWSDDAPWQKAASKVQVIELTHWWLDGATDAQVLALIGFVQRHHMKIGMQIQAVQRFVGNPCGTT